MNSTKTAKNTSRTEQLRAVAEHPSTPALERDLARRAMARMLQRAAREDGTPPAAWIPKRQGEMYQATRRSPLTEVTKLIRGEIQLLRKLGKQAQPDTGEGDASEPIGDAPAEIKISVRQPHHGSINIAVTAIPENWGWRRKTDDDGYEHWDQTDALRQLGNELYALASAYNYDDSDVVVDHYDQRYYLLVDAAEPGSEQASHGIGG